MPATSLPYRSGIDYLPTDWRLRSSSSAITSSPLSSFQSRKLFLRIIDLVIPHPQSNPDPIDGLSHPGCYSLIIDLKRKKTICVGKLGEAVFPAGTYVYTGSAMQGLGGRLRRHCTRIKKMHWHIDHLLTLPDARIEKIILYPAAPGQECLQNKRIAARAAVILKNFGASDCKSGCTSHLLYFAKDFLPKFPGRRAVDPGSGKNWEKGQELFTLNLKTRATRRTLRIFYQAPP
jgi:Uri superfamily endonuclease